MEIRINEKELLKRLVYPHPVVSREVQDSDIKRIVEESRILFFICFCPMGRYQTAHAMAHPQIDDNDPLRMFVTKDTRIIINPQIVRHTEKTVDSIEGCCTFADKEPIVVQRYNKIEIEYVTLMVNPLNEDSFVLSSPIKEHLSGMKAKVFQHELSHLEGKYIYEYEPKKTASGIELVNSKI